MQPFLSLLKQSEREDLEVQKFAKSNIKSFCNFEQTVCSGINFAVLQLFNCLTIFTGFTSKVSLRPTLLFPEGYNPFTDLLLKFFFSHETNVRVVPEIVVI